MVGGDSFSIEVRFSDDFEVILFKFFGNTREIDVALVECVTVSYNFVDVGVELSGSSVLTSFEILLYF